MTTVQLASRLGIKQPSAAALEKSEARGSIELATLRRVAEALDCTLVYALVPRESLEATLRGRARSLLQRRGGSVAHSMLLEDQQVAARQTDARLEEALREMNPRVFWDDV